MLIPAMHDGLISVPHSSSLFVTHQVSLKVILVQVEQYEAFDPLGSLFAGVEAKAILQRQLCQECLVVQLITVPKPTLREQRTAVVDITLRPQARKRGET